MKDLLQPSHLDVLAQVAWSRALLAFDFDGTLAPIVRAREQATMRASTQALFRQVCLLFPTAIISGRSRPDVAARVAGARVKYIIGNHGLEPGFDLPETAQALNEARDRLRKLVVATPGLDLEDKTYSLAVHYRRSRNKGAAQDAIHRALARLSAPTRVIPGKCVINVVPRNAPNKGQALLALRTRERADLALYLGDDVTDEDVFRLDQPGRLLTIRVGRSSASAAAYFVRSQRYVDGLLRRLIRFRESAADEGR